jgi:hypothetical protein
VRSIGKILGPTGTLHWLAPDIEWGFEQAGLFHTGNRLMRLEFESLVADEQGRHAFYRAVTAQDPTFTSTIVILERLIGSLTSDMRAKYQHMPNRQCLRGPNRIEEVRTILQNVLTGEVECQFFNLLFEEMLATALVPANQALLCEITDQVAREQLIRAIYQYRVFPELRQQRFARQDGIAIQWTFGRHQNGVAL